MGLNNIIKFPRARHETQLVFRKAKLNSNFPSPYCTFLQFSVLCCRKKKSRLDQLKKESEDAKWKNMSPRERMRLRKQQKADEEAKRIQ